MSNIAAVLRASTVAMTLALALAPPAIALTAPELMRTLADVPSSRAKFVETRHSTLLKEPLVTTGRLSYRRPDHLEKHVQSPFEQSITVDGARIVIAGQGGAPSRNVALPPGPAHALIESLRATLSGDLAALERHFVVSATGDPDDWKLTLTPRDPALGALVGRVDFAGRGSKVLRIEVLETGGDRTVTLITEAP